MKTYNKKRKDVFHKIFLLSALPSVNQLSLALCVNKFSLTLLLAAFSFLLSSCSNDDIVSDTPDAPEQPTTGYRLTFDGGVGNETTTRAHWTDPNGSGSLFFNWDYTPAGEDGNEMVMAIHKESFLSSISGSLYTYVTIKPHGKWSGDAHWAMFETVEEYESPLSSGKYEGYYVMALTPFNDVNEASIEYCDAEEFYATLPMPSTFEQGVHKEPTFLRDYMYMWADNMIIGNATLLFHHIPATFRFKIVNNRPETARINSVKVTVVDTDGTEQPVASESVEVYLIAEEDPTFNYSTDSYTEVTTNINTDLGTGEQFTAYALVLPLAGDAPLQGKKIRFTISASNPDNEYLSFELDAEKIYNANYGEYNWQGGKSYTINMSLKDAVMGLVLNTENLELALNETATLQATVTPDDAYSKEVIWRSEDVSIATVNTDGVVTAVGVGTTSIRATTANGELSAYCAVSVVIPVQSVSINLPDAQSTIKAGETLQLSSYTTITPLDATNQHLDWTSSNPKVATVGGDGMVTAVAGGSTTITATAVNGKSASCVITVQTVIDGNLSDGGDMGGDGDVNVGW